MRILVLLFVGIAVAENCCWQVISMDAAKSLSWSTSAQCYSAVQVLAPPHIVSQGGNLKQTISHGYDPSGSGADNTTHTSLVNTYLNMTFNIRVAFYANGTTTTECYASSGSDSGLPDGRYCFGTSSRPKVPSDLPTINGTRRYAGYNFTRYSGPPDSEDQSLSMDVSPTCEALLVIASDDTITWISDYEEGPVLPTSYFTPPPSCFKRSGARVAQPALARESRLPFLRPFFARAARA